MISWLQTITGGADFGTLMAEAAAVPPGSEGLIALPYLAGERTPVFDPVARGVFAGLTLRHGRGHLFRAAYEGIGFGIRQILEMFDDAHTGLRTVAVGGGLQSPVWAQAVSDITGRMQSGTTYTPASKAVLYMNNVSYDGTTLVVGRAAGQFVIGIAGARPT